EEEKKVVKKRKPVEKMASKVLKDVKKEKPLSVVIEEDGIVVDGARDEKLLDAFGLAVSQVMIEEGVSVPDCTALAKTKYITKEECEEITDKYTGFYEITEDGEAKKVDDIFSAGIKGEEVQLQDKIEFFDSSGNPLLQNSIEFEEFVENSDDIETLKKLKNKIGKKDKAKLENIKKKIDFLKDVKEVERKQKERKRKKQKEKDNNSKKKKEDNSKDQIDDGSGDSDNEDNQ
ncbi:MAG: hypothetical protein GY932_10235, partial [Arcobacter sp.]|nr:hypothetical protein [Arcobacter sp.]